MRKLTKDEEAVAHKCLAIFLLLIAFLLFSDGAIILNTGNLPLSLKVAAYLMFIITMLLLILACELRPKIRDYRKKTYIYIALFVLCNITLGLNFMVLFKLLSFFQTSRLSYVIYNLYFSAFILYMTMNIVTHLQLIYWDIRGVEEKSLRATATMRSILLTSFTTTVFPIILLSAFIPCKTFNLFAQLHLVTNNVLFGMALRTGKESSVKNKITNFVQKIITFNGRWPRGSGFYASLLMLWVLLDLCRLPLSTFSEHLFINVLMEIECQYTFHTFLLVATAQSYFLKSHMDSGTSLSSIGRAPWEHGNDDKSEEEPIDIKSDNDHCNDQLGFASIQDSIVVESIKIR
ncbi:uncharacterized protein LOC129565145 [Sitodiplosis mosellana]|uniref:uncharacterized protein LOC129565145 n=1 Tax=Sitodiplosis mosellana TaxID=263140 RepID=UPI0024438AD3|nr:uncharacterized protein LOC129565145 [Sitodiplosis mosellana]